MDGDLFFCVWFGLDLEKCSWWEVEPRDMAVTKQQLGGALPPTINETMIGLRVARLTQQSTTKQSEEIKSNTAGLIVARAGQPRPSYWEGELRDSCVMHVSRNSPCNSLDFSQVYLLLKSLLQKKQITTPCDICFSLDVASQPFQIFIHLKGCGALRLQHLGHKSPCTDLILVLCDWLPCPQIVPT